MGRNSDTMFDKARLLSNIIVPSGNESKVLNSILLILKGYKVEGQVHIT